MRQWYIFHQTTASHHHQQINEPVFIGEIIIFLQYIVHNEKPVELISACDGASRHQIVIGIRNNHRLHLLIFFCISQESFRIWVIVRLGVSTHIDRSVKARFQVGNAHSKLVLVGCSRRFIDIAVEHPDSLLSFWQSTFTKQLTSHHNLHTFTRGTEKAQQCFGHALSLLPHRYCSLIIRQIIYFQDNQPVISQHPPFAFPVFEKGSKAQPRQIYALIHSRYDTPIFLSTRSHQMVVHTKLAHMLASQLVLDTCSHIVQLNSVDDFFPAFLYKQCQFHIVIISFMIQR